MLGEILNSRIKLAFLLTIGMIGVIASVLAFEHLGGFIPCALCLKQRLPYYWAIGFGLLVLIAIKLSGPDKLVRVGLVVIGLLVLISMGLGAYHSGVEWAWWAGPSECAISADTGALTTSAENLLSQLGFSNRPLVMWQRVAFWGCLLPVGTWW